MFPLRREALRPMENDYYCVPQPEITLILSIPVCVLVLLGPELYMLCGKDKTADTKHIV